MKRSGRDAFFDRLYEEIESAVDRYTPRDIADDVISSLKDNLYEDFLDDVKETLDVDRLLEFLYTLRRRYKRTLDVTEQRDLEALIKQTEELAE